MLKNRHFLLLLKDPILLAGILITILGITIALNANPLKDACLEANEGAMRSLASCN